MRLYLHGRSKPSMLSKRVEQARTQNISSILLSGWDTNAEDCEELVQDLCNFLSTQQQSNLRLLEEVTIQNCQGRHLQQLVASILEASPQRFIVRYDKQRPSVPVSIVNGFLQGAYTSKVQHVSFRGMTLTPTALELLRIALPKIKTLHSLAIEGNFLLQEFEKKGVSILGCTEPEAVVDELGELLREMAPQLTTLQLEQCHIPDEFLADLLESATTAKKCSLTTLKLRGNQLEYATAGILCDWMVRRDCTLKYLDLSWQRLRLSSCKKNYSDFTEMHTLAHAMTLNKSLETFLVSENRLRDRDVKLLSLALLKNSTLQTLELKDCRISQQGFEYMANNLPQLRLRSLDMNGTQRGGDKLKSLFLEPLKANFFLHDLELPNVDSKSLNWLLEWNRAGRRVLVEPTFSPKLWPHLLERADRIGQQQQQDDSQQHAASAIYVLLREKGFKSIVANDKQEEKKAVYGEPPVAQQQERGGIRRFPSIRSIPSEGGDIELELQDETEKKPAPSRGLPDCHNKSERSKKSLLSWLAGERRPIACQ